MKRINTQRMTWNGFTTTPWGGESWRPIDRERDAWIVRLSMARALDAALARGRG
jgi:hypothetical protein